MLVAAVAIVSLLVPAAALAGDKLPKPPDPTPPISPPSGPAPAEQPPAAETSLHLKLKGERGGKVRVGKRVRVLGTMHPWRPEQQVTVALQRGDRTVRKQQVPVTSGRDNTGQFEFKTPKLVAPGRYQVTATHGGSSEATARSRKFKVRYPSLHLGSTGKDVKLFNHLLDKEGYVPSNGRRYTDRTGRAVLAYRKVHGMARITGATSGIFKTLADGRGAYKLKYPRAGKHAEVSIGRQVLVLADNGEAQRTYHVSTGAPGTPSDRGHFRFYRRQPGYNSLRMYMSVYYNRGEAVHGYSSVPTGPASHGCIRTPISDAVSIYNWVRLGMSIYVY
jgi:L,D-transpeptidase catalytic domain